MATAAPLLSEDQFLCSICLDVFTDPVTTPCGHNFCRLCIMQHWDSNVQTECPLCKTDFNTRPEMNVNTFISEIAASFRESLQQKSSSSSSSEEQLAQAGDVPCDVCTGPRLKAVKSCLVCLTSYCGAHLEPHRRTKGLQRHKLIEAVRNLEDRVCAKHDKPLEMFCKTDQVCVCTFCTETNHKNHRIVSLGEEYKNRKTDLQNKEAQVQKMIQQRHEKIQELKDCLKLSKEAAKREKRVNKQHFTALIRSVERSLDQLIHTIEEAQKSREKQAKGFIRELKEEICELMKINSEVQQLSHNRDHLQFLQRFSSLSPIPLYRNWSVFKVPPSHEETVRAELSQLKGRLTEEVAKLCEKSELSRLKRFAVDLTLDPETAYSKLAVSQDRKQVSYKDLNPPLSAAQLACPKRFDYGGILSQQSFSAGRFYYEVDVKGKTDWMVGVAKESIDRKAISGNKTKYYVISLINGKKYQVSTSGVCISVKSRPQKVGVFGDYKEGLISFYDVDTAALIHSFRGLYLTEKLYPYFDTYESQPLTICPVSVEEEQESDSE